MRKHLRKILPTHEAIHGNRWLAPLQSTLLHPRLWHLNRRSAAGAVAVGLFCGLIPGPLQMLGAAIAAVVLRVNLPLSLATTLYTNPLTIVPLYVLAFELGKLALGGAGGRITTPPEYNGSVATWIGDIVQWMIHLGMPLAVGLLLLASLLAAAGYGVVRLGWRIYLIRAWRRRAARQAT